MSRLYQSHSKFQRARTKTVTLVTLTLLLIFALAATLQTFAIDAGGLDPNFSDDGYTTLNLGGVGDYAYDMVLRSSDGKIIVVGKSFNGATDDFAIAQFTAEGVPDTTFDGDGLVLTDFGGNDVAEGVALQADGKIVVAGTTDAGGNSGFAVARYNTTGSLDDSFDADGKLITQITANADWAKDVAIDANGKIVVAGGSTPNPTFPNETDAALARYNNDGSPDTTFDGDGIKIFDFVRLESIVIDGAGKIFGVADIYQTMRLNSDGSPDSTYDGDGKAAPNPSAFNDHGNHVALYPGGKYVVFGWSDGGTDNVSVTRLNSNGSADNTFTSDGVGQLIVSGNNFRIFGGTVDEDGKVIAVGSVTNSGNVSGAVVRFNANGTIDTTFSGDGWTTFGLGTSEDVFHAIVPITGIDRYLVAGHTAFSGIDNDFVVARYLGVEFNPTNTPVTPTITPVSTQVLQNTGFEVQGATAAQADKWNPVGTDNDRLFCNKPNKATPRNGLCAFRFAGLAGVISNITQRVNPTVGVAGDKLILSAWVTRKNLTTGARIRVRINYSNGTKDVLAVPIAGGTSATFTEFTGEKLLTGTVTKLRVSIEMHNGAGKYVVDDIELRRVDAATLLIQAGQEGRLPLPVPNAAASDGLRN